MRKPMEPTKGDFGATQCWRLLWRGVIKVRFSAFLLLLGSLSFSSLATRNVFIQLIFILCGWLFWWVSATEEDRGGSRHRFGLGLLLVGLVLFMIEPLETDRLWIIFAGLLLLRVKGNNLDPLVKAAARLHAILVGLAWTYSLMNWEHESVSFFLGCSGNPYTSCIIMTLAVLRSVGFRWERWGYAVLTFVTGGLFFAGFYLLLGLISLLELWPWRKRVSWSIPAFVFLLFSLPFWLPFLAISAGEEEIRPIYAQPYTLAARAEDFQGEWQSLWHRMSFWANSVAGMGSISLFGEGMQGFARNYPRFHRAVLPDWQFNGVWRIQDAHHWGLNLWYLGGVCLVLAGSLLAMVTFPRRAPLSVTLQWGLFWGFLCVQPLILALPAFPLFSGAVGWWPGKGRFWRLSPFFLFAILLLAKLPGSLSREDRFAPELLWSCVASQCPDCLVDPAFLAAFRNVYPFFRGGIGPDVVALERTMPEKVEDLAFYEPFIYLEAFCAQKESQRLFLGKDFKGFGAESAREPVCFFLRADLPVKASCAFIPVKNSPIHTGTMVIDGLPSQCLEKGQTCSLVSEFLSHKQIFKIKCAFAGPGGPGEKIERETNDFFIP
jgi:hypothetical protein